MNAIVGVAPDLAAAVVALRAGGLVAMPTETVYGLGADARNPAALRKNISGLVPAGAQVYWNIKKN